MPFVLINSHTLHYQYRQQANAPRTFVLINSLGTDLRLWDQMVDLLAPHGSILRFDKPGHGLSGIPQTTLTISDYARDVVGLLDHLSIQKCVLVGLSIGGIIGQRLTLTHPERIEILVLSNTAPKIGTADGWNERIETVRQRGMAAVSDAILQRWFPASFRETHPNELTGYRQMIEQTPPLGYIRACEAIRDEDLTDQISAIHLPTLCIGGTDDLSISPDQVVAMAAKIPNARCEIIDGAGHIPCVQFPETVARLILDFVTASADSTDTVSHPDDLHD